MGFEFLEDEATADIAFQATGNTLEELFQSAGAAMTAIMVNNPENVDRVVEREIMHEESDVEQLLMRFLEDIVFYKDADRLVFTEYNVSVEKTGGKHVLTSVLTGDEIADIHGLRTNPKAVTWHRFTVEKTGNEWRCFVIVDV